MRRVEQTPRTTLHRHAERGSYDRELIDAILDEGSATRAAARSFGPTHPERFPPRILSAMPATTGLSLTVRLPTRM
jgi:hypothetical protein